MRSFKDLLSRKRVHTRGSSGEFNSNGNHRSTATDVGLAHNASGCLAQPSTSGDMRPPEAVFYSHAGYLAHDPGLDAHVLVADSKHLFAAVLTSSHTARGGHYLKQHLHTEIQAQTRKHNGDVPAAMSAALATLNKAFQNLHPFNKHVLEGVRLAVAWVDLTSSKLYLSSNGQCRCVVGKTLDGDVVDVVADVGRDEPPEELKDVRSPSEVVTHQLLPGVDTIVLASQGIWQEMPAKKALLRMHHYYRAAPKANGGSAAAHLTNYTLHRVTQRMRGQRDLRMRSLQSVSNLQSLWTGDKSKYKWGGRQPVRRRRGDVHGDMTAVVLRLDWEGKQGSFKEATKKVRGSSQGTGTNRQYSHWDLVRMHFLEFARDSRWQTTQRWQQLVAEVVQQRGTEKEAERDLETDKETMNQAESKAMVARKSVDVAARTGSGALEADFPAVKVSA